jgi:hypothetical protein
MSGPGNASTDPLVAARAAYLEAAEVVSRAFLRRGDQPQAELTDILHEALAAGRAAMVALRFCLVEQSDRARRVPASPSPVFTYRGRTAP